MAAPVTASSMILRSLQMVGFKAPGDTLTTTEQTTHLYNLNSYLDSAGIDRTMCYQLLEENFALTSGLGTYTIGPSGNFNTVRPTEIVDPCFARDSTNNDNGLTLVDAIHYDAIRLKQTTGYFPRYLYYDNAFVSVGLATIKLYPLPAANMTLFISSWKQLPQFDAITSPLKMPPGYQLMIESNYAIHAAAGIRPVSAEVARIAKESKAAVARVNAPDSILAMPVGIATGRRWSIYADG